MCGAVTSFNDFSLDELGEAFDKLTKDMDNWKMPIHTTIHVRDWPVMEAACMWFTSSTLQEIAVIMPDRLLEVKADGYYEAVGP